MFPSSRQSQAPPSGSGNVQYPSMYYAGSSSQASSWSSSLNTMQTPSTGGRDLLAESYERMRNEMKALQGEFSHSSRRSVPPAPSMGKEKVDSLSMLLDTKGVNLSSLLEAAMDPSAGSSERKEDPLVKKAILDKCEGKIAQLYRHRISGMGTFFPVIQQKGAKPDINSFLSFHHPRIEFNMLPLPSLWTCPEVNVELINKECKKKEDQTKSSSSADEESTNESRPMPIKPIEATQRQEDLSEVAQHPWEAPAPSHQVPPRSNPVPQPSLRASPRSQPVPQPSHQVPPPRLQVPPPKLQVPPPTLTIPPPSLQVPPPSLQVPPPNLQVPHSISNKFQEKPLQPIQHPQTNYLGLANIGANIIVPSPDIYASTAFEKWAELERERRRMEKEREWELLQEKHRQRDSEREEERRRKRRHRDRSRSRSRKRSRSRGRHRHKERRMRLRHRSRSISLSLSPPRRRSRSREKRSRRSRSIEDSRSHHQAASPPGSLHGRSIPSSLNMAVGAPNQNPYFDSSQGTWPQVANSNQPPMVDTSSEQYNYSDYPDYYKDNPNNRYSDSGFYPPVGGGPPHEYGPMMRPPFHPMGGPGGPPMWGPRAGPPMWGPRGPPMSGPRGPPMWGPRGGPPMHGPGGPPMPGPGVPPMRSPGGPPMRGPGGPPMRGLKGPPTNIKTVESSTTKSGSTLSSSLVRDLKELKPHKDSSTHNQTSTTLIDNSDDVVIIDSPEISREVIVIDDETEPAVTSDPSVHPPGVSPERDLPGRSDKQSGQLENMKSDFKRRLAPLKKITQLVRNIQRDSFEYKTLIKGLEISSCEFDGPYTLYEGMLCRVVLDHASQHKIRKQFLKIVLPEWQDAHVLKEIHSLYHDYSVNTIRHLAEDVMDEWFLSSDLIHDKVIKFCKKCKGKRMKRSGKDEESISVMKEDDPDQNRGKDGRPKHKMDRRDSNEGRHLDKRNREGSRGKPEQTSREKYDRRPKVCQGIDKSPPKKGSKGKGNDQHESDHDVEGKVNVKQEADKDVEVGARVGKVIKVESKEIVDEKPVVLSEMKAETPVEVSEKEVGKPVGVSEKKAEIPVGVSEKKAGKPVEGSEKKAENPVEVSGSKAGTLKQTSNTDGGRNDGSSSKVNPNNQAPETLKEVQAINKLKPVDFKLRVRTAQLSLDELKTHITNLEGPEKKTTDPSLLLKAGMLCRRLGNGEGKTEVKILVTPPCLSQMVQIVHSMATIHAPAHKTVIVFNKHFTQIKGVEDAVTEVLNNCEECRS